jgi:hypothetical protein
MTCLTCDAARITHDIPAYRYSYFSDWPNMQIAPGAGEDYRISEVPMVFGTTAFSTDKLIVIKRLC